MKRYRYSGSVEQFRKCICNRWTGETVAATEKRAKSNLAYQFKKETGRLGTTNISLPGKLEEIEEVE